jgi:hypothetical protein
MDTSELRDDLERINNGELRLPTVSSIRLSMDDDGIEEVLVYLCGEQ